MKKKIFIFLLALISIFALCLGVTACGNNIDSGYNSGDGNAENLKFTQLNDEAGYIVSGIGACTDTDIIIPATYCNQPVISIGDSAFRECSMLTSIVIPDSVTDIGHDAFCGCASLTSVSI